jgi:hypothetical protein
MNTTPNDLPRRIPAKFASLFWDGDLSTLDVDRHREQVLERVLQDGDLESVRWVLETYGDAVVRGFILEHGARRLDPKVLSFWYGYYGLGEAPCTKRSSQIGSEKAWRY